MNTTATEINERHMEAIRKMDDAMDRAKQSRSRTVIEVEYFREFVDQMRKEKEVDKIMGDPNEIST